MTLETVQFEVFGKVQGVFFRKYTQAQAQSLGIKGWCANTRQGSVLGVAQGKPEAIQRLKQWLQAEGSPHSKVERCEFTEPAENVKEVQFEGFAIKHL